MFWFDINLSFKYEILTFLGSITITILYESYIRASQKTLINNRKWFLSTQKLSLEMESIVKRI